RLGGAQVNLIPSETKMDLYGTVAGRVKVRLTYDRDGHIGADIEKTYSDGRPQPKKWQMAQYLLDFGVNRSFIKQNVMTYSYSSTVEGMKGQLLEQVKDVYGEQSEYSVDPLDEHRFVCCRYLAEIVHAETGRTVVKAAECMDWLQSLSTALARVNKGLEFTTPDGFPMFQEYLKQTEKRLFITNLVYDEGALKAIPKAQSPQIKIDTDKIDSREQASSVAPNFIHSMDATHLRMTVRNCYAKGVRSFVMIHDSFGTIPADAQTMYETVRETMVEL
ncbi:DNA-directed RNA polymerase, partial [Herbiconiux daphne]